MRRRSLLLAAVGAAAPTTAAAAAAGGDERDPDAGNPRLIEMGGLATPIVQNGRLVSYYFLTVRIMIASGVDAFATRERNHFLRDALVRAAYRESFIASEPPFAIDRTRAGEVFRAAAVTALGDRAVGSVSLARVHRLGQRDAVDG